MAFDNALRSEGYLKKMKFIFLAINTGLLLIACLMVALMISLQSYWDYFNPFLNVYGRINSFNVIFAGGSVTVVATLGYVIAYTGRKSHFIWYGICMIIVMFIELKVLILGIAKSSPAKAFVGEQMYTAIKHYHNTSYWKQSMDFVQLSLECCGVRDQSDWFEYGFESSLPESCCPFSISIVPIAKNCTNHIYSTPCLSPLVEMPELGMLIVYSFVTMLICLEILNIMMTTTLYKKITN